MLALIRREEDMSLLPFFQWFRKHAKNKYCTGRIDAATYERAIVQLTSKAQTEDRVAAAHELFCMFKNDGLLPSPQLYSTLLDACEKCQPQPSAARQATLLREMQIKRIVRVKVS